MEDIAGVVHLTIEETVELMGCTGGWVRKLLRAGKLPGRKFGERCWLIPRAAAIEARDSLTGRSNGKKNAVKPKAKKRKTA
jgi:excisionase family DNA binding protein